MADVSSYSPTDDNNNSASPAGAPEGMSPAGVNDTLRAVMGAVRRSWERFNATQTSTGSSNAYALSYTVAPTALIAGEIYTFIANFTNTGAATLNINFLGAKSIVSQSGVSLVAGQIPSGSMVMVTYTGTSFQVINATPSLTFTGDATGTGTATIGLTLANSGVAAGTYNNIVVDAKGRITSIRSLNTTDIQSAGFGYTPANLAGDTFTGTVNIPTLHLTTAPLEIASGGTGSTSASAARTALGLGSVATQNTGTSGATVPLNNGNNTLSGANTISGALTVTGAASFKQTSSPWVTTINVASGSLQLDYSLGNYFFCTTGGGTFALQLPTNLAAGQSGLIFLSGGGTISYAAGWYSSGGARPALSGGNDIIAYTVINTSYIVFSMISNVG